MSYVFDLDGTLVDSVPPLISAINRALEEFKLPLTDREENIRFAGFGLDYMFEETLKKRVDDNNMIDNLKKKIFLNYNQDPLSCIVVSPNAEKVLQELKNRGEKIAIISNKLYKPAFALLSHCFPTIEFDKIYTPDLGYKRKPSSESLIDFKNIYKEQKLYYVGDTELDWQCAFGVADKVFIGTWGYRSKNMLLKYGIPESALVDQIEQIL